MADIVNGEQNWKDKINNYMDADDKVWSDVMYAKAEDHGSGINGYTVTGYFLRIPVDPQARTALMMYTLSVNNAANDLGIKAYQTASVFKFNSSVMVDDNGAFYGGSGTFVNSSVNGWGSINFQSYLNSDGTVSLHVGQGVDAKDGGANCYGIRLVKY